MPAVVLLEFEDVDDAMNVRQRSMLAAAAAGHRHLQNTNAGAAGLSEDRRPLAWQDMASPRSLAADQGAFSNHSEIVESNANVQERGAPEIISALRADRWKLPSGNS